MPPKTDPRVPEVLSAVTDFGMDVKSALKRFGNPCSEQNINKHLRRLRAAAADSVATVVEDQDLNPGRDPPQTTQKRATSADGKAPKQPKKTPRQVQQLQVMQMEKDRRFSGAFKAATEEYSHCRDTKSGKTAVAVCAEMEAAHGISPGRLQPQRVCKYVLKGDVGFSPERRGPKEKYPAPMFAAEAARAGIAPGSVTCTARKPAAVSIISFYYSFKFGS